MNHKAAVRTVALSLLFLVQLLHARDVNPVLLSTYPPPSGGTTTDVAVSGNLVYACEGEKGLTILDVANPSSPQFVGSIDTPGFASAVVISSNLALVADGTAGLTIADISNRSSPQIVGAYDTLGNCAGIAISGTLAYLSDGEYGLQIIDFSSPAQPVRLGGYNTFGTALSVAISGNYAYIADGDNGLVVIDVTNPATPRKIAGYSGMPATHIAVAGSYAYVSSDGPLVIFDISDPLNPEPISSVSLPGFVTGSSVSGTTAYVVSGIGGLHVLDTTDPFAPTILGTTTLLTNAVRVAIAGSSAFVADPTNGVRVIAAKNPAVMDVVAHIAIPGNIRDLVVSSNYVYLLSTEGMRIVEASNVANMRVVGTYTDFRVYLPSYRGLITLVDTNAFLFSDSAWQIVNVLDPAKPVKLGPIFYRGVADIKASGGYLYLAEAVFDIGQFSLPEGIKIIGGVRNPVETIGNLPFYFQPDALGVRGTTSWAVGLKAASGGAFGTFVAKIDVSNAAAPSLVTISEQRDWKGRASQMQISDTNGFVLVSQDTVFGKMQSLRIFDLDSLADIASTNVNAVQKFALSTNNIYLAKGSNAVEVLRLEGTTFISLGGAGLPDATAITTTTNYVFVGAGTNGLYVLTHYQPAIRLETSFTTNKTPVVKTFGPIGTAGRIQRATDFNADAFHDWQSIQLNSYPQILTDTNSPRAFYRFVSP